MRLKISLFKENMALPLAYQSILQGAIYALISDENIRNQYHEEGYKIDQKKFKCFVFSQLFGSYEIKKQSIIFKDSFCFYLSSQDERFLKEIYQTLLHNDYIVLGKNIVRIENISIEEMKYFKGIQKKTIKTLSPMLLYSTTEDFSTYYKPSDGLANDMITSNLTAKGKAYGYPLDAPVFNILKTNYETKRMVKYKNCIYPAYLCEMEIETDYSTLLFIYNTGISSKGSCGFGMIEVK